MCKDSALLLDQILLLWQGVAPKIQPLRFKCLRFVTHRIRVPLQPTCAISPGGAPTAGLPDFPEPLFSNRDFPEPGAIHLQEGRMATFCRGSGCGR